MYMASAVWLPPAHPPRPQPDTDHHHTPHYTLLRQAKYQRYLPGVRTDLWYKLSAEDVMEKKLFVVPLRIKYREVGACGHACVLFAVVGWWQV